MGKVMEFQLGLVKSPLDTRDYLLKNILPPLKITLPDVFTDLISAQTPVQFQKNLPTCASFTGTGQSEYWNKQEYGVDIDLSEMWLYVEAKKRDGYSGPGTYLRAIYESLLKVGICEEDFFPYEENYPPLGSPKPGAEENASKYKIFSYASVDTDPESMKIALFQNGPVAVGIDVYESFYNTGSNGIVPPPSGAKKGGHALLTVGYDLIGPIFKNSWRFDWARGGYCTIPWPVWEQIKMGDAYTIVDVVGKKLPWPDWLVSELNLGWLVKESGILKGYKDGNFQPYTNVTQHQAITIAKRLKFPVPFFTEEEEKLSWVTDATRGWIHTFFPQYTFLEERWDEKINRWQFAIIIGRYLQLTRV
jgi:hypothetical protein